MKQEKNWKPSFTLSTNPMDYHYQNVIETCRKEYLAFAKSKKHSAKKIRKTLHKQLGYVARDIQYLVQFMGGRYALASKEISLYFIIIKLYGCNSKYMYDNKVHSVEHRIVSISQPWSFNCQEESESTC